MCEVYSKQKEMEVKNNLYLAWHVEAFARSKKLPDLKKILNINKKEQTPEDMLEAIRKANKLMGGVEI